MRIHIVYIHLHAYTHTSLYIGTYIHIHPYTWVHNIHI